MTPSTINKPRKSELNAGCIGTIYKQHGIRVKAIEHYQKFLDLWKDADPGIAEVEDAKERMAGLRSQ